ncbi:hypothetical protein ACFLUX_01415 [Chloroflexota bacterium]
MADKANRKGCSYEVALVIGFVASCIWLWLFTPLINEYLPGAGALVVLPIGSLILSWFKRFIGGLLTIFSSIVPLITMAAIPSITSDPTFGPVMMLYFGVLTVPLGLAGVFIIVSTMQKEERPKSVIGEGETFDFNTTKCPYCNSLTIEGGIVHRAKNEKERTKLGYKTKWQKVCLKCKSKWISLEK